MDNIYIIVVKQQDCERENIHVLDNFFLTKKEAEQYVRENYPEYCAAIECAERISAARIARFGETPNYDAWTEKDWEDDDTIEKEIHKEYPQASYNGMTISVKTLFRA